MLYSLDLFGTLIFAISGAFRAVKYELDILGLIILSIATGVGGGIMRDVLLGSTPPAAFQDELYLITCLVGALAVFIAAPRIARLWTWVKISDALGLAVFAALGAQKAALYGLGPMGIVFSAVITSTGGGVIRDIMVREIPAIIRTDFYATAAAAGGVVIVIGAHFFPEFSQLFVLGALGVTFVLRLAAMHWKFNLPRAQMLKASPSELAARKRNNKRDSKL